MGIPLASNFDVSAQIPLDSRTVKADITARNAILSTSRYQGLKVFVISTLKTYVLSGGILDANWVVDGGGGGVIVVADITARNAIASGDRYDGYLVYVLSEMNIYQLRSGILNSNWVLWDTGLVATATQSLANAAAIVLSPVLSQIVKLKSTGGEVVVTLPNGTISGQRVYVFGDDSVDTVTIANSGNVSSNDDIRFGKGITVEYLWIPADTKWYQVGAR